MEESDTENIKTPQDILDNGSRIYESESALSYGGNVWTYRQISQMVDSLSSSMMDNFGMKKGQRVMVILPPSIQLVLSYFSLWRNGISVIPLDVKTPLPLLDSIASSGKISGIVTYDSLFSQINRDDTSNIYNILTGSEEFRGVLSGRNPDMENMRNRGTRQRAVFEEMCYSERKESDHVDPFTDISTSELQWRKDSTFSFLNFTHRKLVSSLKENSGIFQSRKNQPFIITKEPTSMLEIIMEIIIPLKRGQKLVMVENLQKNLQKSIQYSSLTDNVILWANRRVVEELRLMKKKTLSRISIVLSNYPWNDDEINFLGTKQSSMISISGYEGVGIPIMQDQFTRDHKVQINFLNNSDSNENCISGIPKDFICEKYESDEENFKIDNIENGKLKLTDQSNDFIYLHRGRSIPLEGLSEYLHNTYKISNCKIDQDEKDWRILDLSFSPKGAKIPLDKFNRDGPDFMTPLKVVDLL